MHCPTPPPFKVVVFFDVVVVDVVVTGGFGVVAVVFKETPYSDSSLIDTNAPTH